jgi:hypothetical protein
MSKLRADSTWNGLTPEQREKLDEWLFVEGVSYEEARTRAQREWGIECSIASVGRYYRRGLNSRTVEQMEEAQDAATAVNRTGVRLKSLRDSALKVIGQRMLQKAMAGGDVKELAALGKLLTDGERREIQRERLALARERFEFNAAEAALAELPHVGEMTEEEVKAEEARILAIQHRLFGKDLPE